MFAGGDTCICCESKPIILGRMFCESCAEDIDHPKPKVVEPPEPRRLGADPGRNSFRVRKQRGESDRLLTYKGVTKQLNQWDEELGIPSGAMSKRKYNGWSVERMIETPYCAWAVKK